MRRLALLLLGCLAAAAQDLEIRGIVTEYGTYAPIDAAEVTIKEFVTVDGFITPKVIAKLLTNPRGEYSFHPEHAANFYIEARKDGYDDATSRGKEELTPAAEQPASLTKDKPVATVPPLLLIRPAEISGKVVDSDGNPRAGLSLRMGVANSPVPIDLKTDRAGEFHFTNMAAGKYLIRVAPSIAGMPEFMHFSEAEAGKVDEDVEYGYWPGGSNDLSQALPMQVEPGSRINVGTLQVRTLKYPRVHVSMQGECVEQTWGFVFRIPSPAQNAGFMVIPCEREFLLKFVPPGGGTIYMADLKSKRWASADIDPRYPTVLPIVEPATTQVRVSAPEGVSLSSLGKLQVYLGPADPNLPFGNQATLEPDAAGRAVLPPVPWASHRLSVTPLQPDVYVKTIRSSGHVLSGPVFEDAAGGTLELELDTGAPALAGSVTKERGASYVLLARWPAVDALYSGAAPPFQYTQRVNNDGKYSLRLAPGEYRAIAIPESQTMGITGDELRDLLTKGERVVVDRGEQKTLDLKLSTR